MWLYSKNLWYILPSPILSTIERAFVRELLGLRRLLSFQHICLLKSPCRGAGDKPLTNAAPLLLLEYRTSYTKIYRQSKHGRDVGSNTPASGLGSTSRPAYCSVWIMVKSYYSLILTFILTRIAASPCVVIPMPLVAQDSLMWSCFSFVTNA